MDETKLSKDMDYRYLLGLSEDTKQGKSAHIEKNESSQEENSVFSEKANNAIFSESDTELSQYPSQVKSSRKPIDQTKLEVSVELQHNVSSTNLNQINKQNDDEYIDKIIDGLDQP